MALLVPQNAPERNGRQTLNVNYKANSLVASGAAANYEGWICQMFDPGFFRTRPNKPIRNHALSTATKTAHEVRRLLEELVLTAVALWGFWHVIKILFFWAS